MLSDDPNPLESAAAEPPQENQNPETENSAADHPESTDHRPKRNSGRTGPTSPEGKARAAQNATRHGLCAETLILQHESEDRWLKLLAAWLARYQNPAEDSVLYTFVVKTAQAEWHRLRTQKEYDFCLLTQGAPPMTAWQPQEIKTHDLILRYLTTAERRFHRELRALEAHWKAHHAKTHATPIDPTPPTEESDSQEQIMPVIHFVNNENGEAIDGFGNYFPPPPDYVSRPIIPGVYDPNHPAYEEPKQPTKGRRRH